MLDTKQYSYPCKRNFALQKRLFAHFLLVSSSDKKPKINLDIYIFFFDIAKFFYVLAIIEQVYYRFLFYSAQIWQCPGQKIKTSQKIPTSDGFGYHFLGSTLVSIKASFLPGFCLFLLPYYSLIGFCIKSQDGFGYQNSN